VRVQNGSVTATYLDLAHTYTDRGQLESISDYRDTSGALSNDADFFYDGLGRLTSVAGAAYSEAFAYDALGNITTKGGQSFVYSATKHHQVTSAGGFASSLSYDGNGNRLTKALSGGSGSETYTYDALDRLTQVSVSGGQTADFAYDWRGNRVKKTVAGVIKYRYFNDWFESHEGYKTKYVLVNGKILASVDAQDAAYGSVLFGVDGKLPDWAAIALLGSVIALLVLSPGRRRPQLGVAVSRARAVSIATTVLISTSPMLLAFQCGGGTATITHYHLDRLGSTQALTSVTGALVGQARYKAYGETRLRADGAGAPISGTDVTRHEFTGHETELGSGLVYAGARFYDPELGQFLSLDPVVQFASPYAYGPWDPMNGTDPDGAIWPIFVAALWAAAVAFAVTLVAGLAQGANFGDAFKAALKAGAIAFAAAVVFQELVVPLLDTLGSFGSAIKDVLIAVGRSITPAGIASIGEGIMLSAIGAGAIAGAAAGARESMSLDDEEEPDYSDLSNEKLQEARNLIGEGLAKIEAEIQGAEEELRRINANTATSEEQRKADTNRVLGDRNLALSQKKKLENDDLRVKREMQRRGLLHKEHFEMPKPEIEKPPIPKLEL